MKKYQAWLLCLLSALALGIAQPLYMPLLFGPVHQFQWLFGLLALVGYVPLWLVIASQRLRYTFLVTLFTLTLQYIIILFWIYIACHDYGDISPLASAGITVLLPMEIAFMGTLFFTWGRLLSLRLGISFFYLAPFALCAMEYARNYVPFGGFPWGNSGYAVGRSLELLQLASVVGVYGLVFCIGLTNASFCLALKAKTKKSRVVFFSVPLFLIIAFYIFGWLRLNLNPHEFGPTVRVALLQGNIPQDMKNKSRMFADEILSIFKNLQNKATEEGAELIVWPEASYPKTFDKSLKDLDLETKTPVATIVGATAYGFDKDSETPHFHNSAFVQNFSGEVVTRYDKSHLVPFGEYVPQIFVGAVNKIVPGMGAYRPGNVFEPVLLSLSREKRISIGTTICYEGIFPEITRAYALKNASLLVNLTNDAWYGESSAPYQHLLMYQLRSVESGRPFARATNSGISAFIDPYGRIQKQSGLFTREVLVDNIKLINKQTIYARIGDIVPIICCVILGLLTCILIYQRALRIKRKPSHS